MGTAQDGAEIVLVGERVRHHEERIMSDLAQQIARLPDPGGLDSRHDSVVHPAIGPIVECLSGHSIDRDLLHTSALEDLVETRLWPGALVDPHVVDLALPAPEALQDGIPPLELVVHEVLTEARRPSRRARFVRPSSE